MRYGIIGAGAIGGFYGAKLARAGQEVHFLLRSEAGCRMPKLEMLEAELRFLEAGSGNK